MTLTAETITTTAMMARSRLIMRTAAQTTQMRTATMSTTGLMDQENTTTRTAIMDTAKRQANARIYRATGHGRGMTRRAIVARVTLRAIGHALTDHRAGTGQHRARVRQKPNTHRPNRTNNHSAAVGLVRAAGKSLLHNPHQRRNRQHNPRQRNPYN